MMTYLAHLLQVVSNPTPLTIALSHFWKRLWIFVFSQLICMRVYLLVLNDDLQAIKSVQPSIVVILSSATCRQSISRFVTGDDFINVRMDAQRTFTSHYSCKSHAVAHTHALINNDKLYQAAVLTVNLRIWMQNLRTSSKFDNVVGKRNYWVYNM